MTTLGHLTRIPLREIWPNGAGDFLPWLENNLEVLGERLDLDLSSPSGEGAEEGPYLLVRDQERGGRVFIACQLAESSDAQLGVLLGQAARADAAEVIWIAGTLREEHRRLLQWLNRGAGGGIRFHGITVEVVRIDDSRPACLFGVAVTPSRDAGGEQRRTRRLPTRGELYQAYFQRLIDELRDNHHFAGIRQAQPRSWLSLASGIPGVAYGAVFTRDSQARVEVYIDQGDEERDKMLFDRLKERAKEIEEFLGQPLAWERRDGGRGARIYLAREGSIDLPGEQLGEILQWHLESLLKVKEIFTRLIRELLHSN